MCDAMVAHTGSYGAQSSHGTEHTVSQRCSATPVECQEALKGDILKGDI